MIQIDAQAAHELADLFQSKINEYNVLATQDPSSATLFHGKAAGLYGAMSLLYANASGLS